VEQKGKMADAGHASGGPEPADTSSRRALAEFVGTALLLAVVIGSGSAAERLSPRDVGSQLLENATTVLPRSIESHAQPADARGPPKKAR
jgi:hypothetical protein